MAVKRWGHQITVKLGNGSKEVIKLPSSRPLGKLSEEFTFGSVEPDTFKPILSFIPNEEVIHERKVLQLEQYAAKKPARRFKLSKVHVFVLLRLTIFFLGTLPPSIESRAVRKEGV